MNILLIHQYAGNKGDRAVAITLSSLIAELNPNANITISTSHPELWQDDDFIKSNSIRLVPSGWDFDRIEEKRLYWNLINKFNKYTFTILRESYLLGIGRLFAKFITNPIFLKEVKKADIVISVGGHHFTTILSRDLVSPINYDAMIPLIYDKNLICFSQTFGPFDFHNNHNKNLTKKILKSVLLYPREEKSRQELIELGIDKERIFSTYETVLAMSHNLNYSSPSNRNKIAGIAIYSTQDREPQEHDNYINYISDTCEYLIDKGFEVKFFPMELKGSGPDDRALINEIISKISINKKSSVMVYDEDMSTLEHLKEVAKCQIFIGHKTHSTIFAISTGTPLIGIAYHPKTHEFMKQIGIEGSCLDDKYLSSSTLIAKIDSVLSNLDEYGNREYLKALEYSDIIRKQLSQIVSEKK